MSDSLLILVIIVGVLILLLIYYLFKKHITKFFRFGGKKRKKERLTKKIQKKQKKNKEEEKKGFIDIGEKFLFRKEIKVLSLINRILPKEYIAFPKVGIDLILTPIGNHDLYDSIKDKYIDLVIFEEATMKPKIAIDLFDGSIGDEQLDIESPEVLQALKLAELPILEIKVKFNYTEKEIKEPIFKILGIKDDLNSDNENN